MKIKVGTIIYPKDLTIRQLDQLKNKKNITGLKVGKLTVIDLAYAKAYRGFYYRCKCECGNEAIVLRTSLTTGSTKSCGCLTKEALMKHAKSQVHTEPYWTELKHIWNDMIRRCYNPKTHLEDVKYYKEKGITVADVWLGKQGFKNFYEWSMANGFSNEKMPSGIRKLSIDRIDGNKGYSPDNCRWTDWQTQRRNQGRYKTQHEELH